MYTICNSYTSGKIQQIGLVIASHKRVRDELTKITTSLKREASDKINNNY